MINRKYFVISVVIIICLPVSIYFLAWTTGKLAQVIFNSLGYTVIGSIVDKLFTVFFGIVLIKNKRFREFILKIKEKFVISLKSENQTKKNTYYLLFNSEFVAFILFSLLTFFLLIELPIELMGMISVRIFFMLVVTYLIYNMCKVLYDTFAILFNVVGGRIDYSFREICVAYFVVYIESGLVFSSLFALERFSIFRTLDSANHIFDYFYFSFITLSTIGYGDIKPIHIGKFFAVFEGAFGIFLTAITIGILMNYFSTHNSFGSIKSKDF